MPRWERAMEWGRNAFFTICLGLLLLHAKFVSPFMIAGAVLGIAHLCLRWRAIDWKGSWPILLTLGYYVLLAAGTLYSIDPARAEIAYAKCVAYALVPLMAIDLKPKRSWGTALLVGILLLDLLAYGLALYDSIRLGAEGWCQNARESPRPGKAAADGALPAPGPPQWL